MAWVEHSVTYGVDDQKLSLDKIMVTWCKKDDQNAGVYKNGSFLFTMVDGDTHTANKAAIQTKVDNDDGLES